MGRHITKGVTVVNRQTVSLAIGAILLLAVGGGAFAAPSVLGTSGNILTPDDTILASGAFNIAYHGISDGDTIQIFAANIGLLPNLEVGAAVKTNGDTDVLANAKYRVLSEAAGRPAITIGAIDIGSQFTEDPGVYILLSKSLTPWLEGAAEKPVGPLRGHIGVGGGVVKSIFAALDWTATPKLSVMAEMISDSQFGGDTMFNAGIRYAFTNDVRLDIATLDFDDMTYGISFQALKF